MGKFPESRFNQKTVALVLYYYLRSEITFLVTLDLRFRTAQWGMFDKEKDESMLLASRDSRGCYSKPWISRTLFYLVLTKQVQDPPRFGVKQRFFITDFANFNGRPPQLRYQGFCMQCLLLI